MAFSLVAALTAQPPAPPTPAWSGYARNSQHTGLSTIGSQRLERIKWSTPVDLVLQNSPGTIYVHYGTPTITAANTVLVPVRVNDSNVFRVEAHAGADGSLLYTLTTDFTPAPHNWLPPYSPTLSQRTRLYYPGAGGTVYYRDQVDSATGPSGQIAFYGNSLYTSNQAIFDSSVMISTPITADGAGNIYFGFIVTGANPASLTSGLARIASDGTAQWMSAPAAAQGDATMVEVAMNCSPALSNDGQTLYFAVSKGPAGTGYTSGYLVALNSATLAPVGRVRLLDPQNGGDAVVADLSSAAPTVGPDGDVYYGVLESPCCINDDRGWLLHFNSDLSVSKTPGAFGWDTTVSTVPAGLVPSYNGTSAYLLFTKYNNYYGIGPGGNGQNRIAVLDPNATMTDPITGATVMKEVITILGATPEGTQGFREWCINSGAIDPFSKSAIANSEDGVLYRWDFISNSFTQSVRLTAGVGEAYTPTAIGADGSAYAINDGILFAVGQASNLKVGVTHAGAVHVGDIGKTLTLMVTNSGTASTQGLVSTSVALSGVTQVNGTGWTCVQPAGPCTRTDALPPGASFEALTVTYNAPAVAGNLIASATVSSDGAPNSVNATATDTVLVATSCDLNGDGTVTVDEVQQVEANALQQRASVTVVNVQREINAALGLGCN